MDGLFILMTSVDLFCILSVETHEVTLFGLRFKIDMFHAPLRLQSWHDFDRENVGRSACRSLGLSVSVIVCVHMSVSLLLISFLSTH